MEPVVVLAKQAVDNFKKQPGWVWLFVISYAALYFMKFSFVGFLPVELQATAVTWFFYQIGDALDKVTFKKSVKGERVDRFPVTAEIEAARRQLGVTAGVYDLSMKLLEKAGRSGQVKFLNETAKTLRGLLAPALIVALFFSYRIGGWLMIVSGALAIAASWVLGWRCYPRWKNWHRTKLYKSVVALLSDAEARQKITSVQLGNVKMFFWDGSLVATATASTGAIEVGNETSEPEPG